MRAMCCKKHAGSRHATLLLTYCRCLPPGPPCLHHTAEIDHRWFVGLSFSLGGVCNRCAWALYVAHTLSPSKISLFTSEVSTQGRWRNQASSTGSLPASPAFSVRAHRAHRDLCCFRCLLILTRVRSSARLCRQRDRMQDQTRRGSGRVGPQESRAESEQRIRAYVRAIVSRYLCGCSGELGMTFARARVLCAACCNEQCSSLVRHPRRVLTVLLTSFHAPHPHPQTRVPTWQSSQRAPRSGGQAAPLPWSGRSLWATVSDPRGQDDRLLRPGHLLWRDPSRKVSVA